jgi:hypothetical protein
LASPSQQEPTLETIRDGLPPLERRLPRVYIDFAWDLRARSYPAPAAARLSESRRTIVKTLRQREAVVCQEAPLPRSEMWRRRGRYAAVLSPHGGGLDCHRTWEALALGHLVVAPSSALDPLFKDLRVVPVQSWNEVHAKNLAHWLRARSDASRDPLTSRYWLERMRSAARLS